METQTLGEKKELKTKFWECRKQDKTVKRHSQTKLKKTTEKFSIMEDKKGDYQQKRSIVSNASERI